MKLHKRISCFIANLLPGSRRKLGKFRTHNDKARQILEYLDARYGDIASAPVPEESIRPMGKDFPIWVMWWQGEENMTPIVKACQKRLKANANGHRINLVTKDNYQDYVRLPQCILDKVNQGLISLTHLSDVLRVALLAKHGGLWVDSTILTGQPVNIAPETTFYSMRVGSHFMGMPCSWSGFIFGCAAGNPLMQRIQEISYRYWEEHDDVFDYFFVDFLICFHYASNERLRRLLETTPRKNSTPVYFHNHLSEPCKPKKAEGIIASCPFHKLTNKSNATPRMPDGTLTWYGYLTEQS